MKRTTIMLPQDLKVSAARHASRLGVSLGQLIRDSLRERLDRTGGPQEDPFFSDQSVYDGQTPRDLAERHDEHLYGDEE